MNGSAAIVLTSAFDSAIQTAKPKPVDTLYGTPILMFVLEQIEASRIDRAVIVTGELGDEIARLIVDRGFETRFEVVSQSVQRGSADAALLGCEALIGEGFDAVAIDDVVILPSDVVLLSGEQLDALLEHHRSDEVAGTVMCADTERTGAVYCVRHELLVPALRRVRPDNVEGALLLVDVLEILESAGHRVVNMFVDAATVAGIDDGFGLARAEAAVRQAINDRWLRRGVRMVDPQRTYVDKSVDIGENVTLMSGVVLEGSTVISDGALIGPDTHLVDTTVGQGAIVDKTSAVGAIIGDRAHVGPFAALGLGARVEPDALTGPFHADPPL
ncbi:MAG: NTP transferase domain-containing protein [Acidobacteria bacterium]|nr:NTP transferase domain-containing protein [Acidobacteriota bacterium]